MYHSLNETVKENFRVEEVDTSKINWGHWKTKGNGFTIHLIVNGHVKKKKDVEALPDLIKISEYFEYKLNLGDVVQIGIQTWVLYGEEHLHDSDFPKCSNPIRMLKTPVLVYLNTN